MVAKRLAGTIAVLMTTFSVTAQLIDISRDGGTYTVVAGSISPVCYDSAAGRYEMCADDEFGLALPSDRYLGFACEAATGGALEFEIALSKNTGDARKYVVAVQRPCPNYTFASCPAKTLTSSQCAPTSTLILRQPGPAVEHEKVRANINRMSRKSRKPFWNIRMPTNGVRG